MPASWLSWVCESLMATLLNPVLAAPISMPFLNPLASTSAMTR
jgi:hypothetical protein